MGIEIFLLASLVGLVTFDTVRKRKVASGSAIPTMPISNRPTSELAKEWEAKLSKKSLDYYWDPELAAKDPYRAILESRRPNAVSTHERTYSGYPTVPYRKG